MENLPKRKLSDYALNIRVLFYTGVFTLGAGIFFFAFQNRQLHQIVKPGKFILTFAGIGIAIALCILAAGWSFIKLILKSAPFLKSAVILFIMGITFFTVSFSCYINYKFAASTYVIKSSKIIGKKSFRGRTGISYFIKITNNVFTKDLSIHRDLYNYLQEGQYIEVKIIRGKLNCDFIAFGK